MMGFFTGCSAVFWLVVSMKVALAGDYVVVSFVAAEDPYTSVARRLADLRGAKIFQADGQRWDELKEQLVIEQPQFVAFLMRPEQVEVNRVQQLLRLATEMDEDPFVDFAYGVITGRTVEAALHLVEAGSTPPIQMPIPEVTIMGAMDANQQKESKSTQSTLPMGKHRIGIQQHLISHSEAQPAKRDEAYIRESLTRMQGKKLITLAGHGFPDRIVGGPNGKDIAEHRYDGAVVYNLACYTGVTCDWYEVDWHQAAHVKRSVAMDESFCLSMIDSGVGAYVAYTCPRPAGPEMMADMLSLATEGLSVGEQRRRQANSVIVTHLSQAFPSVQTLPIEDGKSVDRSRTVQETVREMSTGGILFGDPAFVPMAAMVDVYPHKTQLARREEGYSISVSVESPMWFSFCADQLEQDCMRLETVVPIGEEEIRQVTVSESPLGQGRSARKVHWGIELHQGVRLLHVKASFPLPEQADWMRLAAGIRGTFLVQVEP